MATPCFDDPGSILQQSLCLSALSKDLKGNFGTPHATPHQCNAPSCKTLKVVQTLKLDVNAHAPCDSHLGSLLNGTITIERLVTAYDQDGGHRGVHAGDFVWAAGGGATVNGRISGMTNEGTHRPPAFQQCQTCEARGVMEGRLCGDIVAPNNPSLNGCHVMAAYRIKFDPGSNGANGACTGTLEGSTLCKCT